MQEAAEFGEMIAMEAANGADGTAQEEIQMQGKHAALVEGEGMIVLETV